VPGLQQLYKKYEPKGLEILAFPTNSFTVEPKNDSEIKDFFTKDEFKVTYPLFSKIDVNGPNTHDVYKFLRANSKFHDEKTGKTQFLPGNYRKFLLDRNGKVVNFFPQSRLPEKLGPFIDELL